jgi:hypothetical protein
MPQPRSHKRRTQKQFPAAGANNEFGVENGNIAVGSNAAQLHGNCSQVTLLISGRPRQHVLSLKSSPSYQNVFETKSNIVIVAM